MHIRDQRNSNNFHGHKKIHWYASVLNKRFLTPFRDGIWNRLQVSVGDRGGGPSHTTQKPSGICPPGTHVRQNEVVCNRRALKYGNTYSRAKNTIIRQNCFRSQVHPTQSVPAKHFHSYVHPTQSLKGKHFCSQVHHTQFFPLNRLHY